MRKKIIFGAVVAVLAIGSMIAIPRIAKAETVNSACPNGCLSDGPGCRCNGFHRGLQEAFWKDGKPTRPETIIVL